jgi:hypothetical protein
MPAINTSKDNDRLECISEAHLQFMREYIRREEVASKKTLDLFLAGKLSQRKASPAPSKVVLAAS